MSRQHQSTRRIVLFVEGPSERGTLRRRTLPTFFHNWLDPQLPERGRVGITAESFGGIDRYLQGIAQRTDEFLGRRKFNAAFGLVDIHGFPFAKIGISARASVAEKVKAVRSYILNRIPSQHRDVFHQHFAVHEVEAWLLAYPDQWPAEVQAKLAQLRPEDVEHPAKLLRNLLPGRFKKTADAARVLTTVDPQIAIDKCTYLRELAIDLLKVAQSLQ